MELPILTATILENYLKMEMFKFYEVGGKVRDELLGLTNKDVDYVAVPCEEALKENLTTCDMFQLLWEHLIAEKFEIFLVTPDCYTIRARFPEGYKYQGVADFVMARKEAVEKVRYEEVDCYDSEQIYEVIDELDPVDNNGSPTREIYNDKDELMWHNAELVNRGEIITQGIRSISENLSLIMEGEPESFRGGDIAFSTARRVMEMLGWKCSYAGKATLGQDAYYCIICTKPDKDFKYKIFGNAYEGSISKEKL